MGAIVSNAQGFDLRGGILAISLAWYINTQKTARGDRSYLWGYFIALNGGFDAVWIAATFLLDRHCTSLNALMLAEIYAGALLFFSIEAYKKKARGWIRGWYCYELPRLQIHDEVNVGEHHLNLSGP
jgi:hypothetical protein